MGVVERAWKGASYLLLDARACRLVASALLAFELCVSVLIIKRVPYTEIDWEAYMEEVAGVFVDGELDYRNLRGGTGPLVYPAGFVYIYGILYKITSNGTNILLAQYIFAGLYILTQAVVFYLYARAEVFFFSRDSCSSWAFLVVVASIFMLRLFNDGIASLLAFLSFALFINQKWKLGSFFYSVAVSVKMNILLFAPALLALFLVRQGPRKTVGYLSICGGVQVALGLPFLLHAPASYLSKAFELSRQFFYQWTVNWRCVPESVFLSPAFSVALLVLHVSIVTLYVVRTSRARSLGRPREALALLFGANFIGIAFSRTLHYQCWSLSWFPYLLLGVLYVLVSLSRNCCTQFYAWYFHTLPLLLWTSGMPAVLCAGILGTVEFVFNVYPPTGAASLALHAAHAATLLALLFGRNTSSSYPKKKPE